MVSGVVHRVYPVAATNEFTLIGSTYFIPNAITFRHEQAFPIASPNLTWILSVHFGRALEVAIRGWN